MFHNLIEYYLNKLNEMDRAVARGDQLAEYDHQCADLYAHALKNLLAVSGMLGADHSGRSTSYGYSNTYADGRAMSYNDGHNMGRVPAYGYSSDGIGELVNATNRAMAGMSDDMRQEAQRFLDRLQRSQGMR